MRFKIVTSLSKPLWNKYAKECISTWLEHFDLPEGSEFEFWVQGAFPTELPTKQRSGEDDLVGNARIRWKSLDTQSEGWKDFINTYGNHPVPQVEPGNQYRFNFQPFSCKVFALAEAAWTAQDKFDVIVWLDADTKLTQKVDMTWLQKVLDTGNLAYLDRGDPWGYGETGFIAALINNGFDLKEGEINPVVDLFVEQAKIYGSGQLFFFREWHDAFVFTSIIRRFANTDERIKPVNLNKDMESRHEGGLYPFETSILNERIIHLKGPRKDSVKQ